VTVAVPAATPVKVTVHIPEDRVQLASTVPTAVSDDVKVTAPVGVLEAVVVSLTVAVHVEVALGRIELGLQATLVAVLSLPVTVTVTVAAVLVLVL
jgi:nucleoid-associated protein YgaU